MYNYSNVNIPCENVISYQCVTSFTKIYPKILHMQFLYEQFCSCEVLFAGACGVTSAQKQMGDA